MSEHSEECCCVECFKKENPAYAYTVDWDEHPENYDDICCCASCRSYGD